MHISISSRRMLRLAVWIAILAVPALAQLPELGNVVYKVQSKYEHITVWDTFNGYRQLIFDARFDGTDAIQSEMNLSNPTLLTLPYSRHMIASLPAVANPKRILVVGLGGACIQRYLSRLLPDVAIETAELDPVMLDVAKRYFNLKEDAKQKVAIGDGRKFIENSKDKYDIIMLDAFSATSIPYMLATQEFLKAVKAHLSDGGVVCANLWYEEKDYPDMLKTYAATFAEFHVLRCPASTNAILLALPVKRDLTPDKWIDLAKAFEKAHPTGLDLPRLIDIGVETITRISSNAKVLLDADADKHK
jgi:spermidine synthase